ncbi:hypothetical protein Tco_1229213 [Tanacetum coccineum]
MPLYALRLARTFSPPGMPYSRIRLVKGDATRSFVSILGSLNTKGSTSSFSTTIFPKALLGCASSESEFHGSPDGYPLTWSLAFSSKSILTSYLNGWVFGIAPDVIFRIARSDLALSRWIATNGSLSHPVVTIYVSLVEYMSCLLKVIKKEKKSVSRMAPIDDT